MRIELLHRCPFLRQPTPIVQEGRTLRPSPPQQQDDRSLVQVDSCPDSVDPHNPRGRRSITKALRLMLATSATEDPSQSPLAGPSSETVNPSSRKSFLRYRSTPSLHTSSKQDLDKARHLTSSSRGRANRSISCLSIAARNPDLPVYSLPGPPVPPRSKTTLSHERLPGSSLRSGPSERPVKPARPSLSRQSTATGARSRVNPDGVPVSRTSSNKSQQLRLRSQSEEELLRRERMKLRRSTSETKVAKDKRNEERTSKSRSVHFDGNKSQPSVDDEFKLEPISIIGRKTSSPSLVKDGSLDKDILSTIDDVPPPPPEGKRKVIVAQRPNNLLHRVKSKVKIRRRRKSNSKSGDKASPTTDDEGFESAKDVNGNGRKMEGEQPLSNGTDLQAPLAKSEDIEDAETTTGRRSRRASTSRERKKKASGEQTNEVEPVPKPMTEAERKMEFRKHPYFKLDVVIASGKQLIAMDRGGTSDPYVKCVQAQEKLFQTRAITKTVNPVWGEDFSTFTDNPFNPLVFQVFDKDMVGSDDFMGEAVLDLTTLDFKKSYDMALELKDGDNEDLIKKNKKRKPLGTLTLRLTVAPMSKEEMNEILRAEKMGKNGKGKNMSWSAVVHVVVVQARSLMAMDAGESSDPYCRLSLGREKFKTKSISKTVNPKWREGFDLYWYEEFDNEIEISIYDKDIGSKDDFMGRVRIDLRDLEKEKTHNIWSDVESGEGKLNVLVTISGTTRGDSPSNLVTYEHDADRLQKEWVTQYGLPKTFKKVKDVGHLSVKVLKAQGLHSADLGGKSDPFVVLELVNDRVQTQTEYKTLNPSWMKAFQFDVKDIHDFLEVTVYDEDKDHKYEFLGKIKIPLLKIRNNERRWYMLKDKKLRKPAKGNSPMIQLEMFFVYNKVRASIRTINPKQLKYEDKSDIKFKHSVFMKNVNRVKAATADFNPDVIIREIQSVLNWENKAKSAGCFAGFLIGVYFVELWMVTLALLIPFIKNIIILSVTGGWTPSEEPEEDDDDDDDGSGGKDKDKDGEKKTLKEKMQAMQDITLMVQNGLGVLAHILESIGNVFNFSVPFISCLAMFIFSVVTLLLYFVPLRAIVIAWGINKFTKKLLRPNAINNNELADFISRVPDNEEIKDCRELPSPDDVAKKSMSKNKRLQDNDII